MELRREGAGLKQALRRCYTYPMRRSLRLIFLLLLMTAVPVRSAIGASMMMCGPGPGGPTSALQFSAAAMHHGNHPSLGAVPDHDVFTGTDGDNHATGTSAHDKIALGSATHPTTDTCSLCAACCAGGSTLIPAALTVPIVDHVDDPFPPVLVRFERRPPDGLERPPHPHLV